MTAGTASPPDGHTRAVVLLSGGLDSYTAAAVARADGRELYALSIDYGQRHRCELDAARAIASDLGVIRHVEIDLALSKFGGSALTADLAVPKGRSAASLRAHGGRDDDIPTTYVPARNTIFLSLALGWAEAVGASEIVIGVNALDYSGYPDCRPQFIRAFETLARLATRAGVQGAAISIRTPLIDLTKAGIIRLGTSLGLDYALTHSCYDPRPDRSPCGGCDSCVLRATGFAEAGLADPLLR
jgi:7-cyano-7-deazaguanine synthase